jgi:hypothetical protein
MELKPCRRLLLTIEHPPPQNATRAQGSDLTDEELIDYISETCVMSKGLEEYEGRKSCSITCATRLGQFLGDSRVKDKGLVCHYVIVRSPGGTPTSERAVPVAIFSAEPAVARTYLRRWCGGDIGQGEWGLFGGSLGLNDLGSLCVLLAGVVVSPASRPILVAA